MAIQLLGLTSPGAAAGDMEIKCFTEWRPGDPTLARFCNLHFVNHHSATTTQFDQAQMKGSAAVNKADSTVQEGACHLRDFRCHSAAHGRTNHVRTERLMGCFRTSARACSAPHGEVESIGSMEAIVEPFDSTSGQNHSHPAFDDGSGDFPVLHRTACHPLEGSSQ